MKLSAYILFLAGVVGMTSCEDFLEKSDPTKISTENFYKDEAQFNQALGGVYSRLQGITSGAYLYDEMISDNTTLDFNPSDRGGAANWESIEYSTYNPGTGDIANLWNNHYAALYNANFAISQLAQSTLPDTIKAPIDGQLKFLRAYFYFNLVRYFGDVVLTTEPIQSSDEAFTQIRSPQAEVYTQIESDLAEAINLLPESYPAAGLGRVTKGGALALLGKVYLTQKKYAEAEEPLREAMTLGYELNADYSENFNPQRKNGIESVFEVQYQGGNDLGEWSSFMYTFAPRLSGGVITGYSAVNPAGRNSPTNDIMAAYEKGDARAEKSFRNGYTRDGSFSPVPYVIKYQHEHNIAGRTDDNWPIIRYADVLLMLAEVINNTSGPNAESFDLVNQVRERAGLKAISGLNKARFQEAIMHERRIELAFENHRWFDLKRTMTPEQLADFMNAYGEKEKANPTVSRGGVLFNELDYRYSPFEYYFPIPAAQIQINPGLEQNEGYN